MKGRNEQVDQIFRDRLDGYASSSPNDLWEKLDAKRSTRKKRPFFYRWQLSILGLFLLLSSLGLYWMISGKHAENLSKALTLQTATLAAEEREMPNTLQNEEKINQDTRTANEAISETNDHVADASDDLSSIQNESTISTTTSLRPNTITVDHSAERSLQNATNNTINSQNSTVSQLDNLTLTPRAATQPSSNQANPLELELMTTKTIVKVAPNSLATTSANEALTTRSEAFPNQPSIKQNAIAEIAQAQRLEALYLPTNTNVDWPEVVRKPDESMLEFRPRGCYSFKGARTSYNIFVDAFYSQEKAIRSMRAKDAEYTAYLNERESTEKSFHANSVGFRISMVSQEGFALRSGLVYSQITEEFDFIDENAIQIERITRDILDPITNEVIDSEIVTMITTGRRLKTTYNKYRMVDIPLILGYEWYFKKFSFDVNAGAYFNVLFEQKGDILSSNLDNPQPVSISSKNPEAYRAFEDRLGVSFYGSIGFNYNLNQDVQLLVEPNLRYQFKSITIDDYELEQKYKNIGLLVGVRFRI